MRRTLAVAIVALAVALTTVPGSASETGPTGPLVAIDGSAELALSKALRILDPEPRDPAPDHASEVFRELFESLPELEGEERVLAQQILARPTDGARDPRGHGYTTRSVKDCTRTACLHWVRTTSDAPPNDAWAQKSLSVLNRVYRFEVGQLGYRRPVPDGRHGGNSKFDVYLKHLGPGFYGYCVPEYYKPGSRRVASGYCVIDNDFSRQDYRGRPVANLQVTLAHEFFHAVQFAYDFTDDPWIYESTAVWMEERFADKVNDSRQYLRVGQVRLPHIPLDTFDEPGTHYGNWVWWEYLSKRFGNGIVRQVWSRLDANEGEPNMYSTEGLRSTLRSRGGFTKLFAAYAGANTVPAKFYPEGEHWPSAMLAGGDVLGTSDRRARFGTRVDHMASRNFVVKPDSTLRGGWKLRIKVNGPSRSSAPAAYLIVRKKSGEVERHAITLTRKGLGKAKVGFSGRRVTSVTVTVANASTRFDCRRRTSYSCRGVARDDDRRFVVEASVFR
ncbi:MAG: DUF6055 domain-containing protein [Actinomycetota bacterium]|nr:DUF6055 domain-containing protein [Actinomycetota bacterium]